MTVHELNNYIWHYLEKDKTQTAIMLTGEWGSGKSFYIENELVPFLKVHKKDACVVVSLYGIEELSDISKSIYMELRMRTFQKKSECFTTGKVIAKNVIKGMMGNFGINFDISDHDMKKLYNSIDLKGKLLILEDLERSNIDTTKLLGYVNGLVEHDGVKVLLVANEYEILKKERNEIKFPCSLVKEEREHKEEKKYKAKEVKQYIRIKEKTIGDTIQFSEPLNKAVRSIVRNFDNERLNQLLDDTMLDNLTSIVQGICRRNLRTFVFAIQKSVDIFENIAEDNNYDDDFYQCIIGGILYFSSKIKTGIFPKWEGTEYLSTKLGSKDMPLMKFVYDYIGEQVINLEQIDDVAMAYKRYKFYKKDAEHKDADLRILYNYSRETEGNVLIALKNIENKLKNPECIGIYAYSNLAYYMIYLADIVGFDSEKACELMIKNVKDKGLGERIDYEIFLLNTYDIIDSDIKEKYESFRLKLLQSMGIEMNGMYFSYNPIDLESLYDDICKNKCEYLDGNQFISKYNVSKIVEMLKNCTSAQIANFRGILLAIYRHAGKGNYMEEDVVTLKELLQAVKKAKDEENKWDKIQQLQIDCLISNLQCFIKQMT